MANPKKKKAAKKKSAPKKKSAAKKARPTSKAANLNRGLETFRSCTCMKFGNFYYCMVQKDDGSFERCPDLPRFQNLEDCQAQSCVV
jgi:hypothetical protein